MASSSVSSSVSSMLRRTALYNLHNELKAKWINFCGYSMPLLYGSEEIVQSCLHTRASASLFDASHMGQLRLYGKDRAAFLERLTVADIRGMDPGEARLTLFTNDHGGILDDSIVTVEEDYIRIVVNAGCKEKIIKHIKDQINETQNLVSMDVLDNHSLLALQGPLSVTVLQPLVSPVVDLRYLLFMKGVSASIDGISDCAITRCGYTGEDGFEISVPNEYAEALAKRILSNPFVKPAGLGARDALRIEAGMCLYGHDIDETTTPVEASLSWTIGGRRKKEGGFLGSNAIIKQLQHGAPKKRVGLVTRGGPAREGYEVFETESSMETVGKVTSGTFSPILTSPIAMGYVQTALSKIGSQLFVTVYSKRQPADIVKMPFVPHSYYRGPD